MNAKNTVLIVGSSGFIGKALKSYLLNNKYSVLEAGRKKPVSSKEIEGILAVICLSGENIFGRWTQTKKEEILRSRIESTKEVVKKINECLKPPDVFICASAVGYYGSNKSEDATEDSELGKSFLSEVCQEWENAANECKCSRVINARFGIIFDKNGGALKKMIDSAKCGINFTTGRPSRKISWISLQDLCRACEFSMLNKSISGVVNFTAPTCTTNEMLSLVISEKLKCIISVRIPDMILKMIFKSMADEILLSDICALPTKLMASGFKFNNTKFEDLLA